MYKEAKLRKTFFFCPHFSKFSFPFLHFLHTHNLYNQINLFKIKCWLLLYREREREREQ